MHVFQVLESFRQIYKGYSGEAVLDCMASTKLTLDTTTLTMSSKDRPSPNPQIVGDPIADLLCHEKNKDRSWWRIQTCSSLSIREDGKTPASNIETSSATKEANELREQLASQGLALVNDPLDKSLVTNIRNGILELHQKNLPATFVLLFDETWELARASWSQVLQQSCHPKNCFNFDLLAWHIGPGQSGFSPHRDRQPEDVRSTFHNDDANGNRIEPKFVTNWIALSEATPSNSCLYVIPGDSDPGYLDGDTEEEDPLRRALPDKHSYQRIRAIPRQPGQSLMFSHRIIHWGSRNVDVVPRIAISFVCSDPDYEPPLIDPTCFSNDALPPFHLRLLLVCAQLIIYHQRLELGKAAIKACYKYCKRHENHLECTYRQKVLVEFAKAMKEMTIDENIETEQHNALDPGKTGEEDGDEDEEEAMMEEMLDAENGGYGEFRDDFDEENDDTLDTIGDFSNADRDEDDEEEEEYVDIFGKRALESEGSTLSKKVKRMIEDDVLQRH